MACVIKRGALGGGSGGASSTGASPRSGGSAARRHSHRLLTAAPPQRDGVFIEGAFKGLDVRRCERLAGASTSSLRLIDVFVDCHLGETELSRTLRVNAPASLTSSELLRIAQRAGVVVIAQVFGDGKGKVEYADAAGVEEAMRLSRCASLRCTRRAPTAAVAPSGGSRAQLGELITLARMETNAYAQVSTETAGTCNARILLTI